ncbi:MAG: hypothetical protein J4N31_03020, partial [Chloroflexi bacterium]|nr:hypothetical protein [Chloroflexota bacterium]
SPTPSPTPTVPPTVDPKLAELDAVSAAVATLMADNGLSFIPNPVTASEPPCTTGTTAMTRFPDTASAAGTVDKPADPAGRVYASGTGDLGDKDGYVLFGHDILADLLPSTVVSYVRFVRSVWCYTVEPDGYVRQYDESGAETPRPPRPTPTPTPIPTPTPTLTPLEQAIKTKVGELVAVSKSVAELMLDNKLSSIPNPVTKGTLPCLTGTQDMAAFPDATSVAGTGDKFWDPFDKSYLHADDSPPGDKDGYLLIGHDFFADGLQDDLQSYIDFATTAWCYSIDSEGTVEQHEPGQLEILDDVDQLRAAFSDDDGSARLVLLVSPHLAAARGRAIWVQQQILNADPELDLKLYVVWNARPLVGEPALKPSAGLEPDDRIAEYWDTEQHVGRWLASNLTADAHAFDAYFLFGPEARWGDTPPDLRSTAAGDGFLSGAALRMALEALFPDLQ